MFSFEMWSRLRSVPEPRRELSTEGTVSDTSVDSRTVSHNRSKTRHY